MHHSYNYQRCQCYECRNPRLRRPYGPFRFIFDATLTLVTGGVWLIWVFIREMWVR